MTLALAVHVDKEEMSLSIEDLFAEHVMVVMLLLKPRKTLPCHLMTRIHRFAPCACTDRHC